MSVVLMWGHCLRHRPYIKQHMSAGRVAHRKRLRHRPPHLTATCMRVELMVSQRRRQRANIKNTFFEKLMNIQYLNLPPYPNRWMVWLIQQGLAWRPRCVKTCCQEDGNDHLSDIVIRQKQCSPLNSINSPVKIYSVFQKLDQILSFWHVVNLNYDVRLKTH